MTRRSLRRDWPFRRVGVVLSGGGALGAYQIGVLKVLESVGLRPAIVCGLSVGAINAVAWVAHGFRTAALERTWARVSPGTIGLRWTSLSLRALGLLIALIAALELVLTLVGSDELAVARLVLHRAADSAHMPSTLWDVMAWIITGALGWLLARTARRAEDWLSRYHGRTDPQALYNGFGWALLIAAVIHVATWVFGWPWPHRFSATVLVIGGIGWLANRPGNTGDWVRSLFVRLSPESGGRGLWRGLARTRLLQALVARGDPGLIVSPDVHLLVNAVAVDTGRMCYFLNWKHPSTRFQDAIECALGEFVELTWPEEMVLAASASSAIPVLFQPVRIVGREFVDAGMFSSQAIHAVIADGADAVLTVLMSPVLCPTPNRTDLHLFEVGARLLELGNWRDLRTEMKSLSPRWSREGDPARLCVVEPDCTLPGGLLRFDPHDTAELVRRGEQDAWRALEAAGWLAPAAASTSEASSRISA